MTEKKIKINTLKNNIEKSFNHKGFIKYFANTSWLFFERIFRMTLGLFIGVWVARYLGPEKFGLFSYVQSIVGIFIALAALGLDEIVIRELVNNEEQKDVLLGTAFGLKIIGSIPMLILLGVAVQFTSNDQHTNVLIFIVASSVIFQSFNVIDFYFQSKVLSKYIVYANIITLTISSVIKIILILTNAKLIAFATVIAFDSFTLACGYIYFYYFNTLSIRSWRFDKQTAKRLLHDSWPLILSSLVLMIHARIDQVMIKEMIGNEEVGYYSVSLRLIELFGFIPMMLKSSVTPAFVSIRDNKELYNFRFLNYYRLSFLLFLVTATPIYFFSEQIVILFFGVEYQRAGFLLALFSTRLFFTNFGVARGVFILSENLFMYSLVTMIIGTISNIMLNLVLIPLYQGIGAIIATMISFSITQFIIDTVYKKTRENVILSFKGVLTFYKIKVFK